MTDLQTSLNALLDLFENENVQMRRQLKPAATDAEIEAYETRTGMALPEEAKALYKITNGQMSPFGESGGDFPFPLEGHELVGNLFGSYEFMSLDEAAQEYANWMEMFADLSENDIAGMNMSVSVRDGDNVHGHYFNKGWLPIAKDGGGNSYALDMDPPEGGVKGQLIVVGPDEYERRVLGSGLAVFFQALADQGSLGENEGEGQRPFYHFG